MNGESLILPLSELKIGELASLYEIQAGRNVTCRLTSLGFTPGVMIEMIQNYGHGPVVVSLRDTRVALGRNEARKTIVRKSIA